MNIMKILFSDEILARKTPCPSAGASFGFSRIDWVFIHKEY